MLKAPATPENINLLAQRLKVPNSGEKNATARSTSTAAVTFPAPLGREADLHLIENTL